MKADPLISLSGVSLFYGEKLILRQIDLAGKSGTISLILGANGAGKSSLMRLMAGLSRPSTGEINYRPNISIAYLGHPTFLYPDLTARQNLIFWARAHKIANREQAVNNALAKTGLSDYADEKARSFSRGMAQRLNFSRCLLLAPDLLLLDEPFTGMDQPSQEIIRQELVNLSQNGACVYMVSHTPEVDAPLAHEIFRIENRRIARVGEC